MWIELRNFKNARGAQLQLHSSRWILPTLTHGLYDDAEDREAFITIAKQILSSGRQLLQDLEDSTQFSAQLPNTEATSGDSGNGNIRLAHDIAMILKDSDKKFSGELGECWMDLVDQYSQVSRDYGLNPSQKLHYIHNLVIK